MTRLEDHRDRRLTLVCAPAGSGKSTLLSEWHAATALPTAWVTLDERDRDPAVLVSYLIAALRGPFPDLTFASSELVESTASPSPDVLAASLANDLDALGEDFLLVVDDYQTAANPATDQLLTRLLQHPPQGLHLAVGTRTEPAWPLATYRARGELHDVGFADLRFTPEETEAFLHATLGRRVGEDLLSTVAAEADGWAAGLQLLSLVIDRDDRETLDLGSAARTRDAVHDFLLAEVLASLAPAVQERLLRLSVLRRFNAELCEALCAETSDGAADGWGRAFLRAVEHDNLFVTALDPDPGFFRFHALFKRFLQERLRQTRDAASVTDLHRRASHWFAANGWIEEALEHALAAGDDDLAVGLVATHRHRLYAAEEFARLSRWLQLVPPQRRDTDPELLLASARIATVNCQYAEAMVLLERAEERLATSSLPAERRDVARGELELYRGIVDFWRGDADAVAQRLALAHQLLPPHCSPHLTGLTHVGEWAIRQLRGQTDEANAYLARKLAETASDTPVYASLLQLLAFEALIAGRLSDVETTARRLRAVSAKLGLSDMTPLSHYLIGVVHWSRNDLALAREAFSVAVDARYNLRLNWWCHACGGLAVTLQAMGEATAAQGVIDEAEQFLLQRQAVGLLKPLAAYRAELARAQGRADEAFAWSESLADMALVWPVGVIDAPLARARAALSHSDDEGLRVAAQIVADLRALSERRPSPRLQLEVAALDILISDRRGETAGLLERLADLVVVAERERTVRLFVDLGEPMAHLLRRLAAGSAANRGAQHLLRAFPRARAQTSADLQAGLVDPLSDRELEVLARLAAHLSNKEIADELYIAPSTVKRHTINIYRKLEVADRRSAVQRAARIGLLEPPPYPGPLRASA